MSSGQQSVKYERQNRQALTADGLRQYDLKIPPVKIGAAQFSRYSPSVDLEPE